MSGHKNKGKPSYISKSKEIKLDYKGGGRGGERNKECSGQVVLLRLLMMRTFGAELQPGKVG